MAGGKREGNGDHKTNNFFLPSKEEEYHLVLEYLTNPTPRLRTTLFEKYMPFANHLAQGWKASLPSFISYDDICAAAHLGLLRAIDNFDGRMNFLRFAAMKIKGEIIQEFRAQDPLPRYLHHAINDIQEAERFAMHFLQRQLTASELSSLAQEVITPTMYQMLKGSPRGIHITSLSSFTESGKERGVFMQDSHSLDDNLYRHEVRSLIFQHLTPVEARVFDLYYYDGLSLHDIGETLHLSESRVSRIRLLALKRIREKTSIKNLEQITTELSAA